MSTTNSLETNTLHQILDEIIAEMKSIDENITRMEELLNQMESEYVKLDEIIENLKSQIK